MLTVDDLTCSFDETPVLRGIDLTIQRGEIFCLLGSSGCGKTTLLRIIAGLEQADSGRVLLEGENIIHTPVHQRDFGLMFQDFALFPHMNVAKNVMFGLKMQGQSKQKQERRMREVLDLVGLTDFTHRDVSQLSGGERQRVALARSLAPNPRLLMLDEPLGSLDAGLRERLAIDLRKIIKQVGLTAIYVTHDQQEAFAIADRVAIMNAGRVEQVDTPQALYQRPKTVFAAQFLGLTNIVPVQHTTGTMAVTAIGEFPVTGQPEALLIHPDGIHLTTDHIITGTVVECIFQGGSYRLQVALTPSLSFTINVASRNVPPPKTNETVGIKIDENAILPLRTSPE